MTEAQAVFPETRAGTRIPPLSLSIFWTLSGYAVYMACQWAMLVVVARLGSPEQVGELALGIAVSAPVVLFTNLGLRRLQVTGAAGGAEFGDYFGLRILMSALAMATVAAAAAAGGYGSSAAGAIVAMGLAKIVEAASDVVYGALQQGERMDLIAGSLFLRGIAGVAGLAAGMATTRSVGVAVLALAAGWTAVLVFYDLPCAARVLAARGAGGGLWPRWSPPILGRLARLALPLGLVTTLMSVMASLAPLFIERIRGTAELGLYTALAYAYAASHRVASAVGEAASARLARHWAEGRRPAFLRVMRKLLGLAAGGGLAGLALAILVGRPLLAAVYGPVYAERAELLVGFMAVAVVADLGIVLDYTMTAMRRFRIQPMIYAGATLVYAGLCFFLISKQGLSGAVVALGAVSLLQGLVTLGFVARTLRSFPAEGSLR